MSVKNCTQLEPNVTPVKDVYCSGLRGMYCIYYFLENTILKQISNRLALVSNFSQKSFFLCVTYRSHKNSCKQTPLDANDSVTC